MLDCLFSRALVAPGVVHIRQSAFVYEFLKTDQSGRLRKVTEWADRAMGDSAKGKLDRPGALG